MSDASNPNEFTDLEATLRGLTPSTDGLDRDRTIFLAGRASRDRSHGIWSILAATGWLLALFGSGLWWSQRAELTALRRPIPSSTAIVAPRNAPPVVADDDQTRLMKATVEYLRLRTLVLTSGVETLAPQSSGEAHSAHDAPRPLLLKDLL